MNAAPCPQIHLDTNDKNRDSSGFHVNATSNQYLSYSSSVKVVFMTIKDFD